MTQVNNQSAVSGHFRRSSDPLAMDKERLSRRIERVFRWLRNACQESWESWRSANPASANGPHLLQYLDVLDGKWFSRLKHIVIVGLEDPGTLEELLQHQRGELRGALLERQRVIFTQIAFINKIAATMKARHHAVAVYVHKSGFSKTTRAGLRHLNIWPISDLGRAFKYYYLLVDLRTEQGPVIDSRNLDEILDAGGSRPPMAIMKRCSTISPSGDYKLVRRVARDYNMRAHMELPCQPAPMKEAEQIWFQELRGFEEGSLGRPERQEEQQSEVVEESPLLNEHERRAAELARNIMALVTRKEKKKKGK